MKFVRISADPHVRMSAFGSSGMWCLRMWRLMMVVTYVKISVMIVRLKVASIISKHHILKHHIPELRMNVFMMSVCALPTLPCAPGVLEEGLHWHDHATTLTISRGSGVGIHRETAILHIK